MTGGVAIPLAVAALLGGGFLLNEWSHGGLSEAAGLGHGHMLDAAGEHCAAHDDPALGAVHIRHMHGAEPVPHAACPGGPAMHGPGAGMGPMSGAGRMHDA